MIGRSASTNWLTGSNGRPGSFDGRAVSAQRAHGRRGRREYREKPWGVCWCGTQAGWRLIQPGLGGGAAAAPSSAVQHAPAPIPTLVCLLHRPNQHIMASRQYPIYPGDVWLAAAAPGAATSNRKRNRPTNNSGDSRIPINWWQQPSKQARMLEHNPAALPRREIRQAACGTPARRGPEVRAHRSHGQARPHTGC